MNINLKTNFVRATDKGRAHGESTFKKDFL